MLIATVAIAGIPPLAGFWSKDEILWKAYQANWVYWAIGAITALHHILLYVPPAVHDLLRGLPRCTG